MQKFKSLGQAGNDKLTQGHGLALQIWALTARHAPYTSTLRFIRKDILHPISTF
jgi:hypothetical protein